MYYFIAAIISSLTISSCSNNREPVNVLKEKYYYTDAEVSGVFNQKCSKCHDGVIGKKVNASNYEKVREVWTTSTSGNYKDTPLYNAVKQPGGTMIGIEFGGLTDFQSQVIIKWLETGADQSK